MHYATLWYIFKVKQIHCAIFKQQSLGTTFIKIHCRRKITTARLLHGKQRAPGYK